jgi:hypothetical protein
MMVLNKLFLYLFILGSLFGCTPKYATIHEEVVTVNKDKLRDDSLIHDTVLNIDFSRLVKPNSYGIESVFKVPNEFKDKELRIIFRGKGKTDQVYTNSYITIAILQEENNKVLIWKAVSLKYSYTDGNKWCWFSDSIEVGPRHENKTFNYIDVSAYLGNTSIEKFDMDTLIVEIKSKL